MNKEHGVLVTAVQRGVQRLHSCTRAEHVTIICTVPPGFILFSDVRAPF